MPLYAEAADDALCVYFHQRRHFILIMTSADSLLAAIKMAAAEHAYSGRGARPP